MNTSELPVRVPGLVSVAVRTASAVHRTAVASMMAAAFAQGPVADWLIPDPTQRLRVYGALSRLVFDHAHRHGLVHVTDAYLGAAVWHTHDNAAQATLDDGGTGEIVDAAGPDVAYRLGVLDAVMADHTPTGAFAYLAYLGVYPTMQSRGVGSQLLRHQHHHLDTIGSAAFLVATSHRSRDLYLRHGYAVTDVFDLPDGPPLWAMWRPSRDPTRAGGQA